MLFVWLHLHAQRTLIHPRFPIIKISIYKSLLRNDNGTVFKSNDHYPLTKDVFRLYYTSLSSDRQTIDVYVEDSFGRVKQLTFSFNNEQEEGKDKPASSRH